MNVLPTPNDSAVQTDPVQVEARRSQLARLAHEFEAMFLSEMLRGMRSSMLTESDEQGLGKATMTDTFDSELGLSLSKSGGFGLANLMLQALDRQGLGQAPAPPTAPAAALTAYSAPVPPATHQVPATLTTPEEQGAGGSVLDGVSAVPLAAVAPGPVTSPFGWRADPFTGKAQFHAGTDVRMAYGHEVQAVAQGRVQSVTERQGYGLTVVIDHGNGLETRYAHLSGADVREGDIVEAGQVVARSGNSGRSTGPHLHLEARQHGQAVEISTLLKDSGLLADSYADRSHVRSGQ